MCVCIYIHTYRYTHTDTYTPPPPFFLIFEFSKKGHEQHKDNKAL